MNDQPERPITQEERDSAQRLSDAVNLHVIALQLEGSGRDKPGYIAIRLEDGRPVDSSNPLYDSRADAARHNASVLAACYVKVGRMTMPVAEALIVLQMNRMAYKRGVVFSEEEIIVPQLPELMQPFIPRTLRGLGN